MACVKKTKEEKERELADLLRENLVIDYQEVALRQTAYLLHTLFPTLSENRNFKIESQYFGRVALRRGAVLVLQ